MIRVRTKVLLMSSAAAHKGGARRRNVWRPVHIREILDSAFMQARMRLSCINETNMHGSSCTCWWVSPVEQSFKMVYLNWLYLRSHPDLWSSLKVQSHLALGTFFSDHRLGLEIFVYFGLPSVLWDFRSARESAYSRIFSSVRCATPVHSFCIWNSVMFRSWHSFQFLDIFLNCFDDHWYQLLKSPLWIFTVFPESQHCWFSLTSGLWAARHKIYTDMFYKWSFIQPQPKPLVFFWILDFWLPVVQSWRW